MNQSAIQPCTDVSCGIHGRGASVESQSITCVRQILRAHDRPGAIALLEREPVLPELGSRNAVIPMSSQEPVEPGAEVVVSADLLGHLMARPARTFRGRRLVIADAVRAGWIVRDIVMGKRSQIAPHHDLPSEMFGTTPGLAVFDRINSDERISVTAKRVAATPAVLFMSFIGETTTDQLELEVRSRERVAAGESQTFETIVERAMTIHRFVVAAGDNWMIEDIRINNRSQFVQAGPALPGHMFGAAVRDSFVKLDNVQPGDRVSVIAKYVGLIDGGEVFSGTFIGQAP